MVEIGLDKAVIEAVVSQAEHDQKAHGTRKRCANCDKVEAYINDEAVADLLRNLLVDVSPITIAVDPALPSRVTMAFILGVECARQQMATTSLDKLMTGGKVGTTSVKAKTRKPRSRK